MNKYTHTAKNSKKQYKEKTANVCVYMHTYMYVHTRTHRFLFPNNNFIVKPLKIYRSMVLIT